MRVEFDPAGRPRRVVLSRRNLLALIEKLDGSPADSACTIGAPRQYGDFYVSAEEDGPHYHHPEREEKGLAGVMWPEYERGVSPSVGVAIPAPE